MKNRTGLLISIFILFIIPFIGYLVLRQGAKDRMEISSQLKPKDSLNLDFQVVQNVDDVVETVPFTNFGYTLTMLVNGSSPGFDREKLKDILFIINDRSDIGFVIYSDEAEVYQGDRIHYVELVNYKQKVQALGDIILFDDENRVIMTYKYDEDRLYGRLLEDVSYLLPMLDYQREQKSE